MLEKSRAGRLLGAASAHNVGPGIAVRRYSEGIPRKPAGRRSLQCGDAGPQWRVPSCSHVLTVLGCLQSLMTATNQPAMRRKVETWHCSARQQGEWSRSCLQVFTILVFLTFVFLPAGRAAQNLFVLWLYRNLSVMPRNTIARSCKTGIKTCKQIIAVLQQCGLTADMNPPRSENLPFQLQRPFSAFRFISVLKHCV